MTAASRRVVLVAVVGVLVVLAVGVGLLLRDDAGGADQPPAGLDDVKTFEPDRDHVDTEVNYQQSPPVGGPHDPAWQNCGAYDRPVREENAVHTLEHGAVWITYRPGLSADEIDNLADKLPEKGILSPFEDQEAPVVVTVWGAQLALDGPDDSRLDLFIREYGDGHTAPEPQSPCVGGVEEFEDSGDSA
jgi:Protein of unknown function (DUF3105)